MKKSKANDLALLTGEGMAVFPLTRNTRVPLDGSHGFKDATNNLNEARDLFEANPTANIGVATGPVSGVMVLDIDVKKGKPGNASLAEIESKVGRLTNTAVARTCTGGRHLWFKYPGKDIGIATNKPLPGIDIRGDGGYVVAPHSTVDGGKYEWVRELYLRKRLPDDLHELILHANGRRARSDDDESEAEQDADKKASDPALCRAALRAIKQKVMDSDDYSDCIKVGRAIKGALSEDGLKDWHGWASKSDEYTETWADQKWESFKPPHTSGAGSIFRWAEESGWVRPKATVIEPETEGGLAKRFIQQHGTDVRYDEVEETWYAWNGTLWTRQPKKAGDIQERVKASVDSILDDLKLIQDKDDRKKKWAWHGRCDRRSVMQGAMGIAASDPKLRIAMDKLDQDPLLLGTQTGIVNLRTGKLVKAAREQLVTRSVAVGFDPNAECPRWEQFIEEIMLGDKVMIAFMRRLVGYLLIGGNPLRLIFFLYGVGRNGKSVFIETLLKLFGDYGEPAKSELIMKNRMDRDAESAQPFMLKLRGKRYITASEVGEGMQLDAALVKTLTAGDEMTCRGLHAAPVKFTIEGKFVIRCNHRPIIDGADQAIWDRVVEIPFDLRLDESKQDTSLRDTLTAELPGILNWAIVGCRRYQKNKMLSAKKMLPSKVRRQTKSYRNSQDTVATWLNDFTEAGKKALSTTLFSAYERWCGECSRPPLAIVRPESRQNFNKALAARNYTKRESNGQTWWHGVKLTTEDAS